MKLPRGERRSLVVWGRPARWPFDPDRFAGWLIGAVFWGAIAAVIWRVLALSARGGV